MGLIHRYIGGAVLKTFFLTLTLLLLVFTLGTAFKLLRDDLTISQFLRVLPFAVLYTLPYLLPVSLLAAVTLTYGRLVADGEITAFKASGVSPMQLMLPGLLPGLIATVLVLQLEATVLPCLHWETWNITSTAIEEFLTLGKGKHKSFRFPASRIDLYLKKFENGRLEGVVIRKRDNSQDVKLVAREGTLEVLPEKQSIALNLRGVSVTVYGKDKDGRLIEHSRVRVKAFNQLLPMHRTKRLSPKDLSSRQVRRVLDRLDEFRINVALHGLLYGPTSFLGLDARNRADLAMRTVTPFAGIVLVLIGVPVSLLIGSDNRLFPFFVSFVVASLVFFLPYSIGKSIADKGTAPLIWLWLGPGVGGLTGILLTLRAAVV